LVSTDYTNDTRSSIVDAPSTMVVNGTQLKVYAWYDNEMGYAHRLVDVALMVGTSGERTARVPRVCRPISP
jgi:glyceraldehyde 3-phosphate dehydrogenase